MDDHISHRDAGGVDRSGDRDADLDADRSGRIREIVDRIRKSAVAGAAWDIDEQCAIHADLLPDLRNELSKLAVVLKVLEKSAKKSPADANDTCAAQELADESAGAAGSQPPAGAPLDSSTVTIGRYLGDYLITEEIGSGGMGVVYKATQTSLQRQVALKVMRPACAAGKEARDVERRFLAEARMAAQLRHPNIVTVHEVRELNGNLFFVMACVEGPDLRDLCKDAPLAPEVAARFMAKVADAISYAHSQNILHRDIKPHNILVDAGEPLVTDFGLAKHRDAETTVVTETGKVLGTASFMSPEQAMAWHDRVDERSDVYSLGATLYALLTTRPPFQAGNPAATILQVVSDEPLPPRRLNPSIPKDLETIVLKCLEKPPHRRYQSAGELRQDLNLFLANKPIAAKPVGMASRIWRWCSRNALVSGLAASAALLLVVGSAVSIFFAIEASQRADKEAEARRLLQTQKNLASRRAAESQRTGAIARSAAAHALGDNNDAAATLLYLAESHSAASQSGDSELTNAISTDIRHWLPVTPQLKRRLSHPQEVTGLVVLSDGRRVATACRDGKVRIWNLENGECEEFAFEHPDAVHGLAAWPGTDRLVSLCRDQTFRVLDVPERRVVVEGKTPGPTESNSILAPVTCDPQGPRIAIGGWNGLAVYDANSGQMTKRLVNQAAIEAATFFADGRLVGLDNNCRLRIWSAGTYQEGDSSIEIGDGAACRSISAVVSPDMRFLATGQLIDHKCHVHEFSQGRCIAHIEHGDPVLTADFSQDGRLVATASQDNSVRAFDLVTRQPMPWWLRHTGWVRVCKFHPNSRLLITSSGPTVSLWQLPDQRLPQALANHERAHDVRFTPDSKRVACVSGFGAATTIRVWNLESQLRERDVKPQGGYVRNIAFIGDNDAALVGLVPFQGPASLIINWDMSDSPPQKVLGSHSDEIWRFVVSPDHKLLACGTFGFHPHPSGSHVAVFSVDDGRLPKFTLPHRDKVLGVAFSPDGKTILTGSNDRTVRFWDASSGRPLSEPMPQPGEVRAVAVSPNGKFYCSAGSDQTIRQRKMSDHSDVGRQMQHQNIVQCLRYTPDGRYLVSASADKTVRLWHPPSGLPIGPTMKHSHPVVSLDLSADGRWIASGDERGEVRLWPLAPAELEPATNLQVLMEAITGCRVTANEGIQPLEDDAWRERVRRLGGSYDRGWPAPFISPASPIAAHQNSAVAAELASVKQKQSPSYDPGTMSTVTFDTIWVRDRQPHEFFAHHNLHAQDFAPLFQKYSKSHRALCVTGYIEGDGQPYYGGIWRTENSFVPHFARVDLARETFYAENETLVRDFRLTWLDIYGTGEQRRYAAVWTYSPTKKPWTLRDNLDPQELLAADKTFQVNGYRPTLVTGYAADGGETRFLGMWAQDSDESRLELLTPDELKERVNSPPNSVFPSWLSSVGRGGSRIYAVIWKKTPPETEWRITSCVGPRLHQQAYRSLTEKGYRPISLNAD